MMTAALVCALALAVEAAPAGGERSAALSISATVIRPVRIERAEGGTASITNSEGVEVEIEGGAFDRGETGSLLVTATNGASMRITLRY